MKAELFTVIYQTGGSLDFRWNRTLVFGSRELCNRHAETIRRGGRVAYVKEAARLSTIGLPDDSRHGGEYVDPETNMDVQRARGDWRWQTKRQDAAAEACDQWANAIADAFTGGV